MRKLIRLMFQFEVQHSQQHKTLSDENTQKVTSHNSVKPLLAIFTLSVQIKQI